MLTPGTQIVLRLFQNYFLKRYLPRWLVFFFDLHLVLITFLLAYLLRFNLNAKTTADFFNYQELFLILFINLGCFLFFKSYAGILRQSTTEDIARIFLSLGIGSFTVFIISFVMRQLTYDSPLLVPYSIIIIHFAISSNLLLLSRIIAKQIFTGWLTNEKQEVKIMIYGAGKLGQITQNVLTMDDTLNVRVVGFIDDNFYLQHRLISGIPVYSIQYAFKKVIKRNRVKEIIFALEHEEFQKQLKRELVEYCMSNGVLVKEVPPVHKWINGALKAEEIKAIKIEDLLSRDAINLDRKKIKAGVKDAVILVAGAAGSIGSEIVHQLILFQSHHVVLLDKAESDLYDLQNDILARNENPMFSVIVGDVTNKNVLRKAFEKYRPSIVINAAAYKHVPLMEEYPCEAIRVNIGGTKNLADLSIEYKVKKFVFISTDKAVNPTSVMGTTKRISEIYVQSLAESQASSTQFITTRFGNVLGSNGSVVPLFKKQIENGGPVTVTHPNITRYFMTIPEACQLVLEACFMGHGGEIFVFDMGKPVSIFTLAEKMILLSGYIPNQDINIQITGLRPGEKLYEELLDDKENLLPTYNEKIMIAKVRKYEYEYINNLIIKLIEDVDILSSEQLIHKMKNIVPEFISANSVYNKFDQIKINVKTISEFNKIEEIEH